MYVIWSTRFRIKNNNSKKNFFFLSPTHFFFHSVPPVPYLFYSSYFPSVFIQYFSPLSHFATSIPHVLNCLSLLIAHSAPCFLSFRLIPVFSLLVRTTKSRHHFSLFCTLSLSRPSEISSVIHLSYSLLYLDSLILSILSCFSVSLSLSLSSTFIHLPFALNLSTSSLAYPFLW
jgi:hypothetical protein